MQVVIPFHIILWVYHTRNLHLHMTVIWNCSKPCQCYLYQTISNQWKYRMSTSSLSSVFMAFRDGCGPTCQAPSQYILDFPLAGSWFTHSWIWSNKPDNSTSNGAAWIEECIQLHMPSSCQQVFSVVNAVVDLRLEFWGDPVISHEQGCDSTLLLVGILYKYLCW